MRESRELRALAKEVRGLHETGLQSTTPPAPPAYVGGIGNSRFSPARVIVMLARAAAGGTMVAEEEVDVVDVADILDAVDPADVVDPAEIVDEVEVADEVDVLDDAVEGGW